VGQFGQVPVTALGLTMLVALAAMVYVRLERQP
jgi:hypothetical protein